MNLSLEIEKGYANYGKNDEARCSITSTNTPMSTITKKNLGLPSKFFVEKQKQSSTLPVFKEFHSDLATDRVSTRDDESDFEFDK
jgi:hypothetical protein